jgi:hypothetical protein
VLSPPPSTPPPSFDLLPKTFPFCQCDTASGTLPFGLSAVVELPNQGLGLSTFCFQVRWVRSGARWGVQATGRE